MGKTIDSIWEQLHSAGKWGAYPPEHVIRFVARNYYSRDRASVRLLDFGCGQGANTRYLAREGFDTYAFDGSESAVRKTRDMLRAEGLTAKLVCADAPEIDYENDFFDAVIDNACIYSNTTENIKAMYGRVFEILKPGGKLLTVCFGEELEGYRTGRRLEERTYTDIREGVLADRGTAHIFSRDELIGLLAEAGFVNTVCDWCKYTDRGLLVHQYICSAEKP